MNEFLRFMKLIILSSFFITLIFSACSGIVTEQNFLVTIEADGQQFSLQVLPGTTIQQAVATAGISLSTLDRLEPPSYLLITEDTSIHVIRVQEIFEIEETVISYDRQTVQNESMPSGQQRLIQPGVNGLLQTTYRRLLENGIEISRTVFSEEITQDAVPEIIMVGVQTPFSPISIPGELAYLVAGNAWLMENSTGDRRPLVTTGDLDGHIFSISPDGRWLLFSRTNSDTGEDTINSLWVLDLNSNASSPVSLGIDNIIHFASWVPGRGTTISYSTVEPRETSPGWQANNDLHMLTFTESGITSSHSLIIDTNGGGAYGWWGMNFSWSPDGTELAYIRPDSVGLVDIENNSLNPLMEITPYNSRSDWAWVPGISWSPDSNTIFVSNHLPLSNGEVSEESPIFGISALVLYGGPTVCVETNTGMFNYPVLSPQYEPGHFSLAYLQAIFSEQSDTSRYRLVVSDRDGSNDHIIFPPGGSIGMDPQQILWAPELFDGNEQYISLLYQGNIWLVNAITGDSFQITGDGLTSRIDWR